MYHLVDNTIGTLEDAHRILVALLQLQTRIGARPSPASTIFINTDDRTVIGRNLAQLSFQLQHIVGGPGIRPGIYMERRIDRSGIEQSAFLSTYPHTILMVEAHGIDIGGQRSALGKCEGLYMLSCTPLLIVNPIAIFARYIDQALMHHHVVQMVGSLHQRGPLVRFDVQSTKLSILFAVAYLEKGVVVGQNDRRAEILIRSQTTFQLFLQLTGLGVVDAH